MGFNRRKMEAQRAAARVKENGPQSIPRLSWIACTNYYCLCSEKY